MPVKRKLGTDESVLPEWLRELAQSFNPADTVTPLEAPLGAALKGGEGIVQRLLRLVQKPSNPGDKMLKEHIFESPRMREFHPKPEVGTLNDLPQEEIDKAIDLSRPRPHLERKKPPVK